MDIGLAAIAVVAGALVAAWLVVRRTLAPKWNLSQWQADGFGHWVLQPVLSLDGEEFRFDTPDGYIAKLKEVVRRHPSAVGHVTQLVWQLERVRGQFQTATTPEAITVIERWETPAH